ncbi:transcriptional regulator [Pantoea sp. Ap-967]|uniref:transcriptional regulator n=1 Tax=Pantoea sp. Ap-967 TaxID=2608362 RepID=UPI00141F5FD3|nr:transcriptional regulator [Pantoea sp. Ap-967]NIE77152.1 transcriptional regulator [Pantoea sp. Ap-967]
MKSHTAGIKIDPHTKSRIQAAAQSLDRSPHWFMRYAISLLLTEVENGASLADLLSPADLERDRQKFSVELRLQKNDEM